MNVPHFGLQNIKLSIKKGKDFGEVILSYNKTNSLKAFNYLKQEHEKKAKEYEERRSLRRIRTGENEEGKVEKGYF